MIKNRLNQFPITMADCYTRREWLAGVAATLAGVAVSGPLWALAGCGAPPLTTDRTTPRVLADMHLHAGLNAWNRKTPLGIKYPEMATLAETSFNRSGMSWQECHKAGVDLICATHFNAFDEWLSMPTDPDIEVGLRTLRMLDLLEDELHGSAAPYANLAKNPKQMRDLLAVPKHESRWRIPVLHTVEGGHALGGRLELIETLAKRGVAMIGITHFFNNGIATSANSFPYFPDANSSWPRHGLSEFGHEVIAEMERLGMIVDVTHATNTAIEQILQASSRPLVATHASARTLADHPYSMLDDHLEEVAGRGGLIGVILDPYLLSNYGSVHEADTRGSLRDVVRTIKYLAKLIGHKHVGIGSDYAGFISPPKEMTRISQIGQLRSLLLDEFSDATIVDDILANNAIEFIKANWNPGV
jgi:microsomal dipeptidase-like Zn-dependent dipeptidase